MVGGLSFSYGEVVEVSAGIWGDVGRRGDGVSLWKMKAPAGGRDLKAPHRDKEFSPMSVPQQWTCTLAQIFSERLPSSPLLCHALQLQKHSKTQNTQGL